MTRLERALIFALLVAILIGTALTYRHVTAQRAELEGRIEYLAEDLKREIGYRKQLRDRVKEMFGNYWRE